MIGGIVIAKCGSRLLVRGTGATTGDKAWVYLTEPSALLKVKVGDQLWWQVSRARWTPADRTRENGEFDIKLEGKCMPAEEPKDW